MKKLACIALIAGLLPILPARAQTNFTPGRYWCDTQDVTKAASQHKFNQWYQAESLRKEIVSRVVSNALDLSATNLTPVWEVVSTTNIATSYIICTGTVYDATNGAVRYDVTPAGANLAPGNYRGYSRLLQSVGGTNINIAVLQYQDIQVLDSPDSENYGMVGPITPTSYVQNVIDGGTSGSVGVVTRSGANVTIVFPQPLAGSGDMLKSVYDVNTNNVVDNAEALGGTAAAAYATDAEVASATSGIWTAIGTKIGVSGVTFENADANGDVGSGSNQVARGSAVTDEASARAAADTAIATTQTAVKATADAAAARLLAFTNNFTFAGVTATNPCGIQITRGAVDAHVITGCMSYITWSNFTEMGTGTIGAASFGVTNLKPGLYGVWPFINLGTNDEVGAGGGGAYAFQGTNNIAPANAAGTHTVAVNAKDNVIGGGLGQELKSGALQCVISGGYSNKASGWANTVVGGYRNNNDALFGAIIAGGYLCGISNGVYYSVTVGGVYSYILSDNSFVGPGESCYILGTSPYSFLGGGLNNHVNASSARSVVCGGSGNVGGSISFVGGGQNNTTAGGSASVVAGGSDNEASAQYASVLGGRNNKARAMWSSILGGDLSTIEVGAWFSSVLAGGNHSVSNGAKAATVLGGYDCNVATGAEMTLTFGERANAKHSGVFVWADNRHGEPNGLTDQWETVSSIQSNEWIVRVQKGISLTPNGDGTTNRWLVAVGMTIAATDTPTRFTAPYSGAQIWQSAPSNILWVSHTAGSSTDWWGQVFSQRPP